MALPARPQRLGRFEIVAKIASGGFSTIYLGRAGEQVAALKVVRHDMRRDQHAIDMFLDEARVLSRLDHPNVIRTFEFGSEQDQHYIATELMIGHTVLQVWETCVQRKLSLRFDFAAWIAARVAEGLSHAHDLRGEDGKPLGLIHRDVNPSNIFLTYDGGVKLFDFGLAKVEGRRVQTSAGIVKGKLSYLAPEQVLELPLDRRADIFTLGTTLWEMTTMKRLFSRDDDVETVMAVRTGPIPDPRSIVRSCPEELARIIKKSLERHRDHRYSSGVELARDLDDFLVATRAADPSTLIPQLLDALFPSERARQNGWLRRSIMPPPRT